MNIPLNLPPGPRQREFLDYLNSALRARMSGGSGTAGLAEDGTFFAQVTGAFPTEPGQTELTWRVSKAQDGMLQSLSVEAANSEVSPQTWEKAAHEFATSVLTATLSAARQCYFRRSFFFYVGPQLDGEYWLPGYRFAPVLREDTEPHTITNERVVTIDQDVSAIDELHAFAIAEESSRRHAARLSLLLDVGLYRPAPFMRWAVPVLNGQAQAQSVRCQLTFTHPDALLGAMPEKGALVPLGTYSGSLAARRVAGELQSLPREARKILRGVDRAAPQVTDAFDRAARLYQVASVCDVRIPSVGLAYRVAAVEAMSAADPTCGGFSQFMRKYITSRSNLDGILDYLYGTARSGHFHGGSFPMGEFARQDFFDPLLGIERFEQTSVLHTCYRLIREAIVNWMQSVVPPESPVSSQEDVAVPRSSANGI